MFMIVHYKENN